MKTSFKVLKYIGYGILALSLGIGIYMIIQWVRSLFAIPGAVKDKIQSVVGKPSEKEKKDTAKVVDQTTTSIPWWVRYSPAGLPATAALKLYQWIKS